MARGLQEAAQPCAAAMRDAASISATDPRSKATRGLKQADEAAPLASAGHDYPESWRKRCALRVQAWKKSPLGRMALINGICGGVSLTIALIILYVTGRLPCMERLACAKGDMAGDLCAQTYHEYALSDAVHGRLSKLRGEAHHRRWPTSLATRYVRAPPLLTPPPPDAVGRARQRREG
jgi:hypothetical protein